MLTTYQDTTRLENLKSKKHMPVKSQQQAKFMRMVANGKIKKKGLSKKKAKEFVTGVPFKSLPKRKAKK